ncbi:MAG: hypothetical protein AAF399_12860 [Bacteroidota bacterium]
MNTPPISFWGLLIISLFSCQAPVPYLDYLHTQEQLTEAEQLMERGKLKAAIRKIHRSDPNLQTQWRANRLLAEIYHRQQLTDSVQHYLTQGIQHGDLWLADIFLWQDHWPDTPMTVHYPSTTAWQLYQQYAPLIHQDDEFWREQLQANAFSHPLRNTWRRTNITNRRDSFNTNILANGWPGTFETGIIETADEDGPIMLFLTNGKDNNQLISQLLDRLHTAANTQEERWEIALLGTMHAYHCFFYSESDPSTEKGNMLALPHAVGIGRPKNQPVESWLSLHALVGFSDPSYPNIPYSSINLPYYPNHLPFPAQLELFHYQNPEKNLDVKIIKPQLRRVARQLKRLGFPRSHIKILSQPMPRSPEADLLGSTIGVRIL